MGKNFLDISNKTFFKIMAICGIGILACILFVYYTNYKTEVEKKSAIRFAEICQNQFGLIVPDAVYGDYILIIAKGTEDDGKTFPDKIRAIYSTIGEENLKLEGFKMVEIQLEDSNEDWICSSIIECREIKKTDWNAIKEVDEFIKKSKIKYNSNYRK